MAKKKMTTVNIKLKRGVRINGVPVRPFVDDAGKKPTIISVKDSFAKQLIAADKAELAENSEKPNAKLPAALSADEQELADAMGDK